MPAANRTFARGHALLLRGKSLPSPTSPSAAGNRAGGRGLRQNPAFLSIIISALRICGLLWIISSDWPIICAMCCQPIIDVGDPIPRPHQPTGIVLH